MTDLSFAFVHLPDQDANMMASLLNAARDAAKDSVV